MRAYYLDIGVGRARSSVSNGELAALGLRYGHYPVDDDGLSRLKEHTSTREYVGSDDITMSPAAMGEKFQETKISFFTEHMHEDEEIRHILAGDGWFDIRDADDQWIRIHCESGDMLVIPAGMYHRFSLTEDNFIMARRYFQSFGEWKSLIRGSASERNPHRIAYLADRGGLTAGRENS